MGGNSWNDVTSAGSDWMTGKLELLKQNHVTYGYDVADSSVSTTWETADLTALCGTDVVAVMLFTLWTGTSSSRDRMIGSMKEVNSSRGVTNVPCRQIHFYAQIGNTNNTRLGYTTLVTCRGADPGKILYAEYHSTNYPIASLHLRYHGRVRP